jgi:hypothetical protein
VKVRDKGMVGCCESAKRTERDRVGFPEGVIDVSEYSDEQLDWRLRDKSSE